MPFYFLTVKNLERSLDVLIELVLENDDEQAFKDKRDAVFDTLRVYLYSQNSEISSIVSHQFSKKFTYGTNYLDEMGGNGTQAIWKASKFYVPNPFTTFATYANHWVYEMVRISICPFSPTFIETVIKNKDLIPTLQHSDNTMNGYVMTNCEPHGERISSELMNFIHMLELAIMSLSKKEAFVAIHLNALFGKEKISIRKLAEAMKTTARQIFNISKKVNRKLQLKILEMYNL